MTNRQIWNVFYIGAFRLVTLFCWLTALSICGPLRTTLLCEHSEVIILSTLSALFTKGTPGKLRGAICYVAAFFSVLLFDYDSIVTPDDETTKPTSPTSLFGDVFTSFFGLSDHKAGIALLAVAMVLTAICSHFERRIAIDIGGAKRLNSFVSAASAAISIPCAFFAYLFGASSTSYPWTSFIIPLGYIVAVAFVGHYYTESLCVSKIHTTTASRLASLIPMVSAMGMTLIWNHPIATKIVKLHGLDMSNVIADEHALSAGVVFAFFLLFLAVMMLTAVKRASHFDLIGTTHDGLPLYKEAQFLQKSTFSLSSLARTTLHRVLESPDSRRIFYFLCLNLFFTFVELIYGFWTNSLGLISDGFHMFFDCAALIMGLVASVVAHWRPTKQFTFGYDRIEILSGFVNGLFLIVIATAVLISGIDRLFDPPHINTHRLLFVSFGGLFINLFGVFAFHSAIEGEDHGHSHGGMSHGHSHGGHGHSHNTNMEGVFLHVLADTLGSVGVIISSFLIEHYGWYIADPLCSIFIAVLIIASVIPLLKGTSYDLLLRVPRDLQKSIGEALQNLLTIEGVLSYRDQHFWRHSGNVVCGVVHVQISPDAQEARVTSRVTAIFTEIGVNRIAVQVEKDNFFSHMSGLGMVIEKPENLTAKAAGYDMALEMIKTT